MVHGASMVHGPWCIHGAWSMVDPWCMVHGPWSMDHGVWMFLDGSWMVGSGCTHGLWSIVHGPWCIVYPWSMGHFLSIVHGPWSIFFPRSIVHGPCMVHGPSLVYGRSTVHGLFFIHGPCTSRIHGHEMAWQLESKIANKMTQHKANLASKVGSASMKNGFKIRAKEWAPNDCSIKSMTHMLSFEQGVGWIVTRLFTIFWGTVFDQLSDRECNFHPQNQ